MHSASRKHSRNGGWGFKGSLGSARSGNPGGLGRCRQPRACSQGRGMPRLCLGEALLPVLYPLCATYSFHCSKYLTMCTSVSAMGEKSHKTLFPLKKKHHG